MNHLETSNIYFPPITFDQVTDTWNIVRKTCKNRKAVFRYYIQKNTNNYQLYQILLHKSYQPYPFRLFLIFEPKPRLVMSQIVSDKVVNHFVARYYLLPYLEKKLIDSNVATRKGKGSKYAEKLLQDYINELRMHYPNQEIFVLKIDISKYFYTISHELLLQMLKRDIKDEDVIHLIETIISETDKPYINEAIDLLNKKHGMSLPHYETGVGLSIGAMTSQFLAIYYLNDLDHLIKEQLRCKYYIRYMDDFVILDTDRARLKDVWRKVAFEIEQLRLKVNPKSCITSLNTGITFLGYKYKIENNRFVVSYRRKTIRKIKHKLEILKKHDLVQYYRSYGSYYGYLNKVTVKAKRKSNREFRLERKFGMRAVEKYEYFKKKYPKSIIFIKEGSFYKTYREDAIILWHLFQYKWNHDTVAFGISASAKVFEYLQSQQIAYVTIDANSEEVAIPGDSEVYDLYVRLSSIHYEKYVKKEELHKLLDRLMDQDVHSYTKIKNLFETLLERGSQNEYHAKDS